MNQIVEFSPEHVATALALWRRVEHIGLNDVDDQPAKIEQFLIRNSGCIFVALEESVLVGACLCGHDSRRGAIYHLAVDTAQRRAGLGRALVAASLRALRRAGIFKCHAFVFKDNPFAEKFWAQEGWLFRDDLRLYSKMPED